METSYSVDTSLRLASGNIFDSAYYNKSWGGHLFSYMTCSNTLSILKAQESLCNWFTHQLDHVMGSRSLAFTYHERELKSSYKRIYGYVWGLSNHTTHPLTQREQLSLAVNEKPLAAWADRESYLPDKAGFTHCGLGVLIGQDLGRFENRINWDLELTG